MKKQSPELEAQGHGSELSQPDYVRELLEAGRSDAAVRGYDVEAGLARHAALVQGGAPLPPWAHELVAGTGGGAAAAASAVKVGAGVATGKIVAGVVLAVVTAGAIAAIVVGAPEKSGHVAPPAQAPKAPASGAEPVPPSASQASDEVDDAVELELPPITATRPKRAGHTAQPAREAEMDPKQAPSSANGAKTLDALIEAVGRQGGSSTRPSSKGHVDLIAPSASVERERGEERQSSATREPSERAEPSAAAQAQPSAPEPMDDARLEREMGMLAVAQKVLKSDPERALRLARQGEREFAGSMFTQERQQVLLLALIELGRISEAKRLAAPYLKRYPNGPFSDRVRSALAAAKPEN